MSHSHPCRDICDDLAGKYPKDFKWTGWHPNDLCYVVPIIKSEEQFWLPENQRGDDNAEITDVPQGFKRWVANNQDRIAKAERRGTLPYFVRDNSGRVKSVNLLFKHQLDEVGYDKGMKNAQKFLLRQKYENLIVITPKGNVVFKTTGNKSNIYFTDEQANILKDNIMIHNHPEGWLYPVKDFRRVGHSLSGSDIKEVIKCDASSIIAISPLYSYEVRRPSYGWTVDATVVYKKYNETMSSLREKFFYQITEKREFILQHLTMKELAKIYGFKYIKKKIR